MNIDDYFDRIETLSKKFSKNELVTKRMALITEIVRSLENQQLPGQTFNSLVFTEEEIFQIIRTTEFEKLEKTIKSLEELDSLFSYFREFLQQKFGYWATITKPFMESFIKEFQCENYLELMAGNGYISQALRGANKKVIATDSRKWSKTSETGKNLLTEVETMDAITAFEKYAQNVEAVIIAWSPDFDEIDYQILLKYRKMEGPKPLFFIIGEKFGATNSAKFWSEVNLLNNDRLDVVNSHYPQYDIVADKLYLVE